MIKKKYWAYLAGLIDGDGTLCIASHPHLSNYINYDVLVQVHTTHKPTVNRLVELFGGQFYTTKDKRPNRKIGYRWHVSSAPHQIRLLSGITDHLVLKKTQAELLHEFLTLGGRTFQNPGIREELYNRCTVENNRFEPVHRLSIPPRCELTKTRFAYLAGLIDAEGTISLYEGRRCFDPKIQLSNSDMRVFNFVLTGLGGTASIDTRKNGRVKGNWNLPVENLEQVLLATIPYLITKKQQGILLLEYVRHRHELSDDDTRKLIQEFRILNRRGSPTTNTIDTDKVKIEPELHGDMQSVSVVTQ